MITMFAMSLAATAAATPATPSAASGQPAPAATTRATAERRYCVVETPTGTRLEQRICRTRAEWLREGFDPLVRD